MVNVKNRVVRGVKLCPKDTVKQKTSENRHLKVSLSCATIRYQLKFDWFALWKENDLAEARDTQKKKLYTAEKCLKPLDERLETTEDVAAFLTKVMNRAPVQARYAPYLSGLLEVRDGRGRRVACGDRYYIKLPKWARSKWIALHEAAHSLTTRKFGDSVAAHGREYASVYLDLVHFGMGKEARDALVASFKQHRVKYRTARGKAKPVHTRRVAFKAKPKTLAPRYKRMSDPGEGAAYREFRKLAKTHGFTYKIDRDGSLAWLETDTFPNSGKPFMTMHMGWIDVLDRVQRCIEDPSLLDEGGGYSE
jgi:putative metallohydrolase (TIGR04338 family)